MLIESFIRDARNAAALLGRHEAENDLHTFIITVHGMKCSLWNVGERDLSEKANDLEQAGRNNNLEFINNNIHGFLEELKIITERLEAECINKADDYTIIEPHELDEKLLAVKEMCADYNRKGALDLLAGIKAGSEAASALIIQVREHILHSDFEEAEALISKYI
jgi:HPt (histidine-containing phosphotransfer) domain-containing protein